MSKFPLLEAMRAARVWREAEITAPLRQEISWLREEIRSTKEGFKNLGRIVTHDYGKQIIAEMRYQAARDMQPKLYDLLGRKEDNLVTIQIARRDLQFMRPDEALQRFLDIAEQQITQSSRVSARNNREQHTTVVSITVPQFQINTAISNDIFEFSRLTKKRK